MEFPQVCRMPDGKNPGAARQPAGRIAEQRFDLPPTIFMSAPQSLAVSNVDWIAYAANPKRRYLEIQNQSNRDWAIAFDGKAKQGFGLIIPAGSSKIFDSYTVTKSEIHLIAWSGQYVMPLIGIGIEGFV